jgi:site-specific DNA recombinase
MKENSAVNKLLNHSVPETKSVGIWIRVSTEDQAQGESPEHHLARARAYATVKGWTVKEVYDLAGVSGKSVMEQPEAKRMLADIRRGHITGLIFSKLARLARNTKELLEFADIFRDCNADMVSLQETIDTSTPAGRLFFTMIAAMAQWEREEIADRVKASVSIRAKLGKSINGRAPYGYQWKDKKLIPHPEEAPIRRKAYELFLQHRRKGRVAKLLNAAGYRTRDGVLWRDTQVARVLSETSAKGIYYFNRIKKHGDWKQAIKPESEWGKVECEPIVPEMLWQQVNQIIEEQLKSWKKPGRLPVQIFGNLAHCACGHKMYVRSNSPKYVCRKCQNKIPIVDLDAIFHEELKAFFADHKRISGHLLAANQNLSEKEALLAAHERKIQKIREEMAHTHRLYLDGGITSQGFGEFYKPAEEQLNQLTAELPKLQAEVDFLKVNSLSADEVLSEAQTLYHRWPELPTDDKRKIAESIVEKIVIGDGEIDITLSYLPSSEEMTKTQQQLRGPG